METVCMRAQWMAEEKLLELIKRTCVEKKGKLIIPSFSVGRTQEVIYSLNNFYNSGKLPKIKVYVDSPLIGECHQYFQAAQGMF